MQKFLKLFVDEKKQKASAAERLQCVQCRSMTATIFGQSQVAARKQLQLDNGFKGNNFSLCCVLRLFFSTFNYIIHISFFARARDTQSQRYGVNTNQFSRLSRLEIGVFYFCTYRSCECRQNYETLGNSHKKRTRSKRVKLKVVFRLMDKVFDASLRVFVISHSVDSTISLRGGFQKSLQQSQPSTAFEKLMRNTLDWLEHIFKPPKFSIARSQPAISNAGVTWWWFNLNSNMALLSQGCDRTKDSSTELYIFFSATKSIGCK